jgi:AraC family transcriptional regulator
MTHRHVYVARINRVIDHIDAHLAQPLDMHTLAGVAHFSSWHFHRVFQTITGETLAEWVRRRRLEVAATRLLVWPRTSATNIALDVGFASPEVFSRAFKAHFGVTPTAWRRGAFRVWAERQRIRLSKIHQADRKAHQAIAQAFRHDVDSWPIGHVPHDGGTDMDVELKTLPETLVAYMRHVGPYGESGITRTWQRFAAWCQEQGLMLPRRKMYGISQDNPDVTPPEKCRYDACVEVDAGFKPQGEIGVQTIAGGRYACAKFTGTGTDIHAAWNRLMGEWLPDSGYQCDDRPCLESYSEDFVIDEKTGVFACLLCVPVRPL